MSGVHIDKYMINSVPCYSDACIHCSIYRFQNFNLVGTLQPRGTVSVDCGRAKTFTCNAPRVSIGWNIAGLSGIDIQGTFLARDAAIGNSRIMSTDTGGNKQIGVSVITITGFSRSDNGGNIQCVNRDNNSNIGRATISVGECVCWVCKDVCLS